jgi:hypothetical protein
VPKYREVIMFRSWVDEANEYVKITDVLSNMGVYVPETIINGGNKKIHCPFGFYHSDGGLSKAMRVYLSNNTAYCFSCSKSYNPVSLTAAKLDCPMNNAALKLLEDFGYKAKTVDERWQEAIAQVIVKPDTLALAEALKTYCSGIDPDWNIHQLDERVGETLTKCLSLLSQVTTDEEAFKWLDSTKLVMSRKLENEYSLSQRSR